VSSGISTSWIGVSLVIVGVFHLMLCKGWIEVMFDVIYA
jgi:hypothetical protein